MFYILCVYRCNSVEESSGVSVIWATESKFSVSLRVAVWKGKSQGSTVSSLFAHLSRHGWAPPAPWGLTDTLPGRPGSLSCHPASWRACWHGWITSFQKGFLLFTPPSPGLPGVSWPLLPLPAHPLPPPPCPCSTYLGSRLDCGVLCLCFLHSGLIWWHNFKHLSPKSQNYCPAAHSVALILDLSGFLLSEFLCFFSFYLSVYFWPLWVSVAAWGLCSSCGRWVLQFTAVPGLLSLQWLLSLRSRALRHAGFRSCSSQGLEWRLSSCGTWA